MTGVAVGPLPGWEETGAAPARGPGAVCEWCGPDCDQCDGGRIPEVSRETGRKTRNDAETCCVVCRKRRHRFKQGLGVAPRGDRPATRPAHQVGLEPARFAYADPPYPQKAFLYKGHPDYAGEVDHADLVARLVDGYPDGWALSTSGAALPYVLSLCPPDVRVCIWRRQVRYVPSGRALSTYEAVVVWRGRLHATGRTQDLLDVLDPLGEESLPDPVLDYRGRYESFYGALIGMKPPEFATWMFRQLGAQRGDTLADLFPGSGAVARAWDIMYGEGSPVDVGDRRDASVR